MLKIHFGIREQTINHIKIEFKNGYNPDWFNDPLVKEMILDVDKSEVLSPNCIQSPILGQISPRDLSGGVKALIMMLKTAFPVNASKCGDNCAKWILKIAEIKDLEIDLEHIMIFDKDFDAVILNDGKEIHDRMSYITEAVNYL